MSSYQYFPFEPLHQLNHLKISMPNITKLSLSACRRLLLCQKLYYHDTICRFWAYMSQIGLILKGIEHKQCLCVLPMKCSLTKVTCRVIEHFVQVLSHRVSQLDCTLIIQFQLVLPFKQNFCYSVHVQQPFKLSHSVSQK